jgi:hypothetical protein
MSMVGWTIPSTHSQGAVSALPAPIPQYVCLPFLAFPNRSFKLTLVQQQNSEEPSGSKFYSSFV